MTLLEGKTTQLEALWCYKWGYYRKSKKKQTKIINYRKSWISGCIFECIKLNSSYSILAANEQQTLLLIKLRRQHCMCLSLLHRRFLGNIWCTRKPKNKLPVLSFTQCGAFSLCGAQHNHDTDDVWSLFSYHMIGMWMTVIVAGSFDEDKKQGLAVVRFCVCLSTARDEL